MVSRSADSAPHELELVVDFVNTLDVERGSDELGDAAGAAAWFGARGLIEPGRRMSARERREAVELREALRALLLEHNGGPAAEPVAAETLERISEQGGLGVIFGAGGESELAPRRRGFAAALAAILVPVARASGDGTWLRAKACRADGCHWAFYDRSRNRSGVWCEMAVCGNREKVRSYRDRNRSGG
jgi:predicted RNA-binding Zn ribbon-like protein